MIFYVKMMATVTLVAFALAAIGNLLLNSGASRRLFGPAHEPILETISAILTYSCFLLVAVTGVLWVWS